jgi:hypothetical protein
LFSTDKIIKIARANETRKKSCGFTIKTAGGKEIFMTSLCKISQNAEYVRFRFYVKAGERKNKHPEFRLTAWFRIVKNVKKK